MGSCGKVLNMVNDSIVKYSRTFTNSHLSTTACSFFPTDSPYIHSNFNLAAKAIKALPNCKITSRQRPVNKRLMKYWYKTPYCYCKRWRKLIHTPGRWCLFLFGFCFIGMLRGTYLQKNVFHDKNVATSHNGNQKKRRRFSVSKVAVVRSFHCNKVLYFFK